MSIATTMFSKLARSLLIAPAITRNGAAIVGCRSVHASAALRQKGLDYYDEIMVDHNNFRDLHGRFIAAYNRRDEGEMTKISNTLVREAALHADGEELSVYRALEKKGLHDCAEKDREGHQMVKQALKYVESHSIMSLGIEDYANAVKRACQLLIKHAEEEERDHFKKLSAVLTADEKSALAKDFLKARKQAPGRPHPSAPQHGGPSQRFAGAMAKPFDAAINATRLHTPLKHTHPDAY